jgi:hypothetical protein
MIFGTFKLVFFMIFSQILLKFQFQVKEISIVDIKHINLIIQKLVCFIQQYKKVKKLHGFQIKIILKHFMKSFMSIQKQNECLFLYLHF